MMSATGWSLLEMAAHLLEQDEREAVLGDLAEVEESTWKGLLEVFGLFFRRQLVLWKDLRTWVAGLGLAFPCSYLLLHVSVSVICSYERLFQHKVFSHSAPTGHEGLLIFFSHIFLLLTWSWTSGFVIGCVSRRTIWASAFLAACGCGYWGICVMEIWDDAGPRILWFLFLFPAIWGIRHGLRIARLPLNFAFLLAFSMTGLSIYAWNHQALWILNWALLLPVWYLVFTALRPAQQISIPT
jgi:hypothetical protein